MQGHYLQISRDLLVCLGARSWTIGTAESCSGGLLAAALTALPGSSKTYFGGIVAYANQLKTRLLGVSEDLLSAHGAVSGEVARAMAQGARERLSVDYAIAVTGIAGPGGGSAEKPVGTVWCAVAGPHRLVTHKLQLKGGRSAIRNATVNQALVMLHREVFADVASL